MSAVTEAAGRRAKAIRAAQAKLAARNAAARDEVDARLAALVAEPEMAPRLARVYQEIMTRAATVRAAETKTDASSGQPSA